MLEMSIPAVAKGSVSGQSSLLTLKSQESDCDSFYDPLDDKPYRHASHYDLPDEVKSL